MFSHNCTWLTVREAANYLQVSPSFVYASVRRQQLRAAVLGGRRSLRFRAEWLDEFGHARVTPVELPSAFAPRAVIKAALQTFAPTAAGDYLLVIDILTPEVGSLAAQGVEPTIVRVHVAEPAPPEPAPTATPEPTPTPAPTSVQLPLAIPTAAPAR